MFKRKDSDINPYPLCIDNISKDFTADNMNKTDLNGYVNEFHVDYESIDTSDILDIHKYLMEKLNINCLDLLKKNLYWIIKHLQNNKLIISL